MVMMDNSGSMKIPMYEATGYGSNWKGSIRTGFDSNIDYYGIFEADKNYQYNKAILVNEAAYGGISIDDSKKGAFYEAACTPAAGELTCWSGRYLNWLTTRRVDASRQVLVGGKLESRSAFAYGSGYQYKIVANNEHKDDSFGGQLSNSDSYSPVPNNVTVMVTSPAHKNSGAQMALYDPYAKLNVGVGGSSGLVFDDTNAQIGEFGGASITPAIDGSKFLTAAAWTDVTFSKTYTDPIVIAKPATRAGGDPALVRIKEVTTSGFKITLQEWPYKDGNHVPETVSYLVIEKGPHTLAGTDGLKILANKISTSKEYASHGAGACAADTSSSETIPISGFSSTPVVIASTMTYENKTAVNARIFNTSNSQFKVALQQEEAATTAPSHSEDIGYIAIQTGESIDATNNWQLEAGTHAGLDEGGGTITYSSSFTSTPTFIAGMTSISETDPAVLRLTANSSSAANIFVEEEKSCGNEINHSNETIGYIALQGNSALNLALVTTDEPTGLLQQIAPDVRLGVSFYRFPPNKDDIYSGVTTQGGTLRFNIPNNPFVKKPSASGGGDYRTLEGYITTPIADVVDSIEHYPLIWGTTPLAENLWEVIQYFEHEPATLPYYTDVATGFPDFELATVANPERDPYYYASEGQKLWCAKSSVIVFTDGFPYKDADVPDFVKDYDDDTHANDVIDNADADAQGQDNLDDVAYWAFCDKSKPSGSCIDSSGKATQGSRDLRIDLTGSVTDDKGQFLHVHTVGFADGTIRQVLQDTADNAGGSAHAAEDGNALKTALTQAFQAAASVSSASAVALNSGSISGGSMLYQARFDSLDWSGQLLSFPIARDGSIPVTHTLDAGTLIPAAASRKIFTFDGTDGKPFQWTSGISSDQKILLNNDITVLNYLRGDQSLETSNSGAFRDRSSTLGDIIHSAPTFVGPPAARYSDNWGSGAAENAVPYSTFKSNNSTRTNMVYVGANDGMYHAFNATSLVEQFAYVPNAIFDKLNGLSDSNYSHQYFVDGGTAIVDAFFSSDTAWHTVLVSGLGAGGQGIFALDVTDPDTGSGDAYETETTAATNALWEFTDSDDIDLGYTYGQPSIVRLQNGKWAAVFGNGYNNTYDNDITTNDSLTGNAVLYIVDIQTGALIKKFDTGVGTADDPTGQARPNGLNTPSVVDVNGDSIADAIYAGDLFGNVWKIDISASSIGSWDFSYSSGSPSAPQAIFTACAGNTCNSTNSQPITTQIQVVSHPKFAGYLLYFGTGKYFEVGDNVATGQVTQSFYGIWDKAEASLSSFTRNNLLQQSITNEVSDFGFDLRVSTENAINWSSHLGWYMDLINTESGNTNNYGERQVSNSVVRNGRIIFTTLLPSDDPCEFGGSGWLMELDLYSGARLPFSPFDLNGDNAFTSEDYVHIDINNDGIVDPGEVYVPASGKKSKVGIIATPSIADAAGGDTEYKYTSGSSGQIEVTVENPGPSETGRQSWRQLDFDL
jgi:PilC-like protein with beta-propeller domain